MRRSNYRRRSGWKGMHSERRRWVGAEWGGYGKGCPLPSRLWEVWGSVVSSPSGVWSRARPKNRFWRTVKATERSFLYLWQNLRGQFALASPTPNYGGTCLPVPPWFTLMGLTSTSRSTKFGEITQNNGHDIVWANQGSSISVPIENPYATSC